MQCSILLSKPVNSVTGVCSLCTRESFKAALQSRGAFFMSNLSLSLGSFQGLGSVVTVQSGYIGSSLIGQNKGTLRLPAALSRVSHLQVRPCTNVQRLQETAVCVLKKWTLAGGCAHSTFCIHPNTCFECW